MAVVHLDDEVCVMEALPDGSLIKYDHRFTEEECAQFVDRFPWLERIFFMARVTKQVHPVEV